MSKAKGSNGADEDMQNLSFEDALKRLETIVDAMESQDLPLEQLLARFDQGIALSRICQTKLSEAEVKIQQLEKNSKGDMSLKTAQLPENPRD